MTAELYDPATDVDSDGRLEVRTHEVPQGTFPLPGGPLGMAFDGANIWVTAVLGNSVRKL